MCGIAGIFAYAEEAPSVDTAELLRIRDQMRCRGPDGEGLWISNDKRIGLAHRRLAIIDLRPVGMQPMWSIDGRHCIVFNGEIYNYRSLRAELETRGYKFRTHTDTEVLLQLYAHYGEAMCTRLRGMFAIAIWDATEHSLFLARDSFGIKPLYVYDDGYGLRFASQVKALLAGGGINEEIEPAGLVGYWIWGHVPEPWSLYHNLVSLSPGSWLRIRRDGKREQSCFLSVRQLFERDPETNSVSSSPKSSIEARHVLRESVLDSIRHHLVADVPVGVFLSAGIDSATLAALAAECGAGLHTVTLGFEEYRGTQNDETILAEAIARQYGTRHQTIWINKRDFEGAIHEFFDAMDQPSTDGLNTWLVSRAAASLGLKVAISGLGGDEFFGGYPSFRHVPQMHRLAQPFKRLPWIGRTIRSIVAPLLQHITSVKYAGLLEYGVNWEGAYLLRRATLMPWELSAECGSAYLSDTDFIRTGLARLHEGEHADIDLDAIGNPHAIVSYLETTRYMRDRLLRDADWAGMFHSLEIRVPLVDVPLLRCVTKLRQAGHTPGKIDLGYCAQPALPHELLSRPKTGFTVPVRDWMLQTGRASLSQRGDRGWQQVVASAQIDQENV